MLWILRNAQWLVPLALVAYLAATVLTVHARDISCELTVLVDLANSFPFGAAPNGCQ